MDKRGRRSSKLDNFHGRHMCIITNHRHISLTETAQCNSNLSKKNQFEKDIQLFFQCSISENVQENQKPNCVFWKDWKFPFKQKYFRFPKWFVNSSGYIWLRQFNEEGDDSLLGGIHPALLLETKKFRGKKVSEFPVVSDYVFNYFYIIQ